MHPVHALRAVRAGDRRHHGTRHDRPRRALRNRVVRRQDRRLRALGQFDRRVPGRRADLEAVPLCGADVGAVAAQVRLAARFARQQSRRAGQGRSRAAGAAARERGGQRVLDLRQGSVLVRRAQFARAPDDADGQAGRRMEGSRLADGARRRRAGPDGRRHATWSGCARRLRVAACDARGTGPGRPTRARAGRRQHRLPAAAERFQRQRPRRGHSVARHARRGPLHARPRARRRQLPAQGSSARRATTAPGREEGHAGLDAAFGRRRLAAARRAQGDRRAVAPARRARRHRRRRRAGERCRDFRRTRRHRSEAMPSARSPRASSAGRRPPYCSAILPSSTADAAQLHALARCWRGRPAPRWAFSPSPRTRSAPTPPARSRSRAG